MDKEELIKKGSEAVFDALKDSFVITNSLGDLLSKRRGSDEMEFSPKLNCLSDLSVITFPEELNAQNVIDNILTPQDDGEKYSIISITQSNPEDGEDSIEIEDDGDEITVTTDDDDKGGGMKEIIDELLFGDDDHSEDDEKTKDGDK